MDKMMMVELGGMKDMPSNNKAVESETKCIKKEFADASSEEVKVEKVEFQETPKSGAVYKET